MLKTRIIQAGRVPTSPIFSRMRSSRFERQSAPVQRALADFGTAEFQPCPPAFASRRNELDLQFYRTPAGQFLRQRKGEASPTGRIGDLELAVWEYAEPANLRLGF